ncbi:MAG TPA: hypothetical protein VFN68_15845 [Acidimicrobiales bacterium]|nr:hypothetical protein [Acidimicrobiales bacterium]
MPQPSGTRLRCRSCGSEAIVIKSEDPQLTCCGQPLEVTFTPPGATRK